jgi:hypothetical protein
VNENRDAATASGGTTMLTDAQFRFEPGDLVSQFADLVAQGVQIPPQRIVFGAEFIQNAN